MNDCIKTLEILNIGGTNVLGEFIPFILLHAKNLRSLGQWINTMIYGLEILRDLPGHQDSTFPNIQEFSYSTDRNYFCQPYIGFVPETKEYRNVRKEMVKQSARVAKRLSQSIRHNGQKQKQIAQDVGLMTSTCPNVKKLNLMLHHKITIMDPECKWKLFFAHKSSSSARPKVKDVKTKGRGSQLYSLGLKEVCLVGCLFCVKKLFCAI